MTTALAIKRMTTVLLREREWACITRADMLQSNADDLYDSLIKPIGKYVSPRMISRFGIHEDDWKQIQERIVASFRDEEQQKVDNRIRDTKAFAMKGGGASFEDVLEYVRNQDRVSGFYLMKAGGFLTEFDSPDDLPEVYMSGDTSESLTKEIFQASCLADLAK